jgi:predicted HTH transcriptional regulator
VLRQLGQVRHAPTLDALIASGEGDDIELKSSLCHQHAPLPLGLARRVEEGLVTEHQAGKEVQKELQAAFTKTIAAFLNTNGDTLLIGVDDHGGVLGIEHDFEHVGAKRNADAWLQHLSNVIVNVLDAEVWSAIQVSLVSHENGTVAVIRCPARASETWHHDGGDGESFYIRTSNATRSIAGPGLVRYIREHWPT